MEKNKKVLSKKIGVLFVIIALLILNPLFSINLLAFDNIQNFNIEGEKLFSEKNYNEALLRFEKALKADPNNIRALGNISITYIKLGIYDKAITTANEKWVFAISPAAHWKSMLMAVTLMWFLGNQAFV